MLRAKEFEILRGVEANGRRLIPLARKPVRVATLIDEAAFSEGHLLIHNRTVFLEDALHDWNWRQGQFSYYTRVAQVADVVIVYEEERIEGPLPKSQG